MENKQQEFFAAALYTCYEHIRPDLVLEYAWRFGMYDFAMPYMIQLVSELKTRVETVQKKTEDRDKKEEQKEKEKMNQPLDFVSHDLNMMMPGGTPMLGGPGGYNSMGGNMPHGPGGFNTHQGGFGNWSHNLNSI